ncbi:hypothetical protein ANN_06812 [Periplaneta americana]|uniref:PiggyBac transposable element-derived protein domain-containing protein n=1 Tax=Periplaneta americana TaxID=6978 RepID=A0ABQ8TFF2_PERAM|nr:hypothetical protein ANN_06812 [Periplaneta americana]
MLQFQLPPCEVRSVTKFLNAQGIAPIEIHRQLWQVMSKQMYNTAKGSVDTIDQMARMYTTKRGTRRWPLSVFYTLIDIACINSYTRYIMTFPDWYKKKTNRRRFYLQELGFQLIKPNVEHRAANIIGLQNNIIMSMEAILKKKITKTTQNQQQTSGKGKYPDKGSPMANPVD